MGQVRQLIPLSEDWSYIHFHPNERLELQEAGEDMFELVVFADKGSEGTSSLYHNYPDIREWRTKDLFRRHPSKPNLWKFHARKDDILVFSSGEKLNPIPMESSVTAIPGVSGALVVGQGQPQAALLVELSHETVFLGGALQELWPIIDRANSLLPGHGRISRSMIIIADAKKPFARAGKGTVVRRLTEEIYATEIENLYQVASPKAGQVAVSLKSSLLSDRDVQGFVRLILSQLSVEEQLGDDENFYAYGMDSVKTSEAVGHLKASLLRYKPEASLAWVSGEVLYRNPTIKQLSAIILDFLIHGITPKRRDRVAEMQAKIADQLSDLPRDLANSGVNHDLDKYSIAITGTTGFLGAQLLAKLSENPRISRIYCLNRSLISTARGIFGQRSQPSTAEVVFLRINFASPKLGLSTEDYTRLLEDCTIIVHNAWHVDFNLALPSFEENVRSTKQLISLSATSKLRPRIVFISSISSTGVFAPQDSPRKTIPEGIVEDLSTTMNIGYAESKHVAEHVLSRSGVPATIIRMGQLAPSSIEGTCPKDDVVSVFLQTCKTSKMLASDFVDLVNWVPVDQAAAIVSEIVQAQIVEKEALQFYNVVHPRPQSWSSVIDTVRAWCGEETRIVSMTDWVDELQQAEVRNPQVHEGLPALRMLAMYGIIASRGPTHEYATKNLMGLSEAMRRLDPVDSHQIETWLRQI
jgi:thioester reductase-like protein/aryl carrier-like protein